MADILNRTCTSIGTGTHSAILTGRTANSCKHQHKHTVNSGYVAFNVLKKPSDVGENPTCGKNALLGGSDGPRKSDQGSSNDGLLFIIPIAL